MNDKRPPATDIPGLGTLATVFKIILLLGVAAFCVFALFAVCTVLAAINMESGPREDPLTRIRPSAPQWTPDGSRIVFAHWGSIYAVAQDGSSLTRIHGDDGNAYDSPSMSEDGSRIAYHKYGRIREELTSALDGSNVRKHAESPDDSGFAPANDSSDVSPDGSRIAFARASYTVDERVDRVDWLYLSEYPRDAEADDFGAKLARGYDIHSPKWSPDGRRLAFVKWDLVPNEEGLYSAHIVSLSGPALDTVHQVVDGLGEYEDRTDGYELDWSPDGTKLLIAGYNFVSVVNVDESGFKWLVKLQYDPRMFASWSPDGSKIAVYHENGHDGTLFAMSSDGSDKRVLALGSVDITHIHAKTDAKCRNPR